MNKVRWGIIGAGRIAHTFARDCVFTTNAEVYAVASRAASRASEFACQYNIPKAYGNYRDLFNDPDVDAIYIATPHNFHLEQSLQAINAGKSVLCEKPLTVNAAEC
ncbi:MAG: Gfo/Idh/MocA family oxidoreductase, partial [Gammaproteobacteria bacterium]|nr:Gfo/Idh/MocA family oxidoreductase [Gammaproteobacteria bacterium]NNC97579.1 Gfo/Idh/MocA family oxidoreductase [Gammaproteobacteria bacterium]NNM14804.1 Gfo/Idh/MocA family oxidoreductase [Gammaproteobacteria bacterium]